MHGTAYGRHHRKIATAVGSKAHGHIVGSSISRFANDGLIDDWRMYRLVSSAALLDIVQHVCRMFVLWRGGLTMWYDFTAMCQCGWESADKRVMLSGLSRRDTANILWCRIERARDFIVIIFREGAFSYSVQNATVPGCECEATRSTHMPCCRCNFSVWCVHAGAAIMPDQTQFSLRSSFNLVHSMVAASGLWLMAPFAVTVACSIPGWLFRWVHNCYVDRSTLSSFSPIICNWICQREMQHVDSNEINSEIQIHEVAEWRCLLSIGAHLSVPFLDRAIERVW